MPLFEYKGINQEGRNVSGSINADNQQSAKTLLKKDNIFIVDLKDKQKSKNKTQFSLFSRNRVDIKTLCTMTRLLATLLKSNVPLVDSLSTITKQVTHPVLGPALGQIKNRVNEGQPFYKALKQYPKIFDTTYISMCEAGENSGTLDLVLLKLAEFTESQAELNNKIRSTMAYPLLITAFTFFIVLFLFIYIIPKITVLFEDDDLLPWYTVMVMSFSDLIVTSWPILLGITGLIIFLIKRWAQTNKGRYRLDALYLQMPVIGKLIRSAAISRFSRTLATLLEGGVPMLTSMDIVQNVAKNSILKEAIQNARTNIREGESIAAPLEKSRQFPPMTIQMIKVGEKTGELENMLLKISEAYDFQVKTEINTLTSLLGPSMIMVMGGIVAFIIFSVMVPILNMYNQIS